MDNRQTSSPRRFNLASIVLIIAIIGVLIAWLVERSNFKHDIEDPFGVLSLIGDEDEHSDPNSIVGTWRANYPHCNERIELVIESNGKFTRTDEAEILKGTFLNLAYSGTYRRSDDGLYRFKVTQIETAKTNSKDVSIGDEFALRIASDESGAMMIWEDPLISTYSTDWNLHWRKTE